MNTELLRTRWADGVPVHLIAVELRISRHTIRHQVERLGLPARQQRIAKNDWSAEQEALLIERWPFKTAEQIAQEIGVTRNAVIGKVNRMRAAGIELRGRKEKAPTTPRKIRARKASQPRMPDVTPPANFLRIPFADLQPNSCRYPIGDGPFLFCGQPKMEESSYCAWCHQICHGYVREPSKRFTPAQIMARAA